MSSYIIYFRVGDDLISVTVEKGEVVQDVIDMHRRLGWTAVWAQSPISPGLPRPQSGQTQDNGQRKRNYAPRECPFHSGEMRKDREGKGWYCHTKLADGSTWCGFKTDNDGKVIKHSRLEQIEIDF